MPLGPLLNSQAIASRFGEMQKPMRLTEARVEANRCLRCFDAPCIHACPSGIDVPAFIQRIAEGNDASAARVIYSANVLGWSCSRTCPTQVLCEGACVLKDRDEKPIEIGRLQRHATDHSVRVGLPIIERRRDASGKRVAIVGAGPAGLGCGAELVRLGHAVTMFERESKPGGLNTFGIARYKLTPEESLAEIARVINAGIDLRCGVEIGRDITGEKLLADFDAVFVGVGLGAGRRLGIAGEELPGVMDALSFIHELHDKPLGAVAIGKRVIVVGGGNTAIDAATQSVRLGASEVTIVYRRSEAEMSAYEFERDIARLDGVGFRFNEAVVRIAGDSEGITSVDCAATRAGEDGAVRVLSDQARTMPCDMLLLAIGQEQRPEMFKRLFPHDTRDRVFFGGDCVNGGREVVDAVGEGKRAAIRIHQHLTGEVVDPPTQPSRLGAYRPRGAGLDAPIREHEAVEAWRRLRG